MPKKIGIKAHKARHHVDGYNPTAGQVHVRSTSRENFSISVRPVSLRPNAVTQTASTERSAMNRSTDRSFCASWTRAMTSPISTSRGVPCCIHLVNAGAELSGGLGGVGAISPELPILVLPDRERKPITMISVSITPQAIV
jgi:hypothetical protein